MEFHSSKHLHSKRAISQVLRMITPPNGVETNTTNTAFSYQLMLSNHLYSLNGIQDSPLATPRFLFNSSFHPSQPPTPSAIQLAPASTLPFQTLPIAATPSLLHATPHRSAKLSSFATSPTSVASLSAGSSTRAQMPSSGGLS